MLTQFIMTTYRYKCLECGDAFDVQATLQEKEEGKSDKFACPHCKSKKIECRFSLLHFIKNVFKGEGESECCCSGEGSCDSGGKSKGEKECCGGKGGCC